MEEWSTANERPYVREEQPLFWWVAAFLLVVGVAAAGYYVLSDWPLRQAPAAAEAEAEVQAPVSSNVEVPRPAFDGERVPSTKPLPTLENSDPMMRDAVSGLVGRPAFEALVYPSQLIRRIVATVDNLPRETAPRRVMPLEPVPGRFAALTGEEISIASANADRYVPYVRVFQSLDTRALVQRYLDSYPLFQRAYAELGYPNLRFNDRLLEAIDDLLASPEIGAPVKLIQPKVHYQFADPELESLSAGQKAMIRMGPENAAKVKAKLREIRRELLAR